ncbi:MAG: response regulator [Coleofasciculus sp. C1-SOL-03]|uniref:response regulator n=1 Tax=Coleofasciculus sp. C1-SOL-03 TaxID=3069522 RepID=UPI0032F3DB29
MTARQIPSVISTPTLSSLEQVRSLRTLQRFQFSGELVLNDLKGHQWIFFLHLGGILYVTGGVHPVRRWQRNLAIHCPQVLTHPDTIRRDLASINVKKCWDYQLLCLWVKQRRITPAQAANMIRAMLTEVVFDIAQAKQITHQIQHNYSLPTKLVLIEINQAIAQVQSLWQTWQNAQFGEYSPNQAPVIKQPEQLRNNRSAEVYQTLTNVLDGQHTLRDLAVKQRRRVVDIVQALMPYLKSGWVELTTIPDLPAPTSPIARDRDGGADQQESREKCRDEPQHVSPRRVLPRRVEPGKERVKAYPTGITPNSGKANVPKTPLKRANATSTQSLVACVDDSRWVIHTMEKVIGAAGYRFVGVENALRAIPTLLVRKPDLIFLDLVMPNVNGYELCTQLRKLSCFQNTPIVFLTGKDGAADRLHAKYVGASDFLSKPLNSRNLLMVLQKHIKQGVC